MATSGVLMAEAESGSCGSSPACNEGNQHAIRRLDLARGDRGCCDVPTVARCAVESARGVEVDLEAHLRASDAIGRQLDGN